ncbi:hypothetical protein MIR68_004610 [Amoeboaphelidium protococcarum]|nr:hypothetical protein MIR68_004610 [Amoeboaphelidium protococcarum]
MPSQLQVYLYWPNVVGYVRILLAVIACYTMDKDPSFTAAAYVASCLFDALDGYLARTLNQKSKFGAVLDMVIDRSTTASLMVYLAVTHPHYATLFQGLIALDFTSHYMHMVSTLQAGNQDHKKSQANSFWLLRLYYENRAVLFGLCAANELFFIAMYLAAFPEMYHKVTIMDKTHNVWIWVMFVCLPWCTLKHFINGIQLLISCGTLTAIDAHPSIKVPVDITLQINEGDIVEADITAQIPQLKADATSKSTAKSRGRSRSRGRSLSKKQQVAADSFSQETPRQRKK